MLRPCARYQTSWLALLALLMTWGISRADEPSPAGDGSKTFYEQQVKPLLEQHCLRCHGSQPGPKGGLRLTNRANILRGGESGAAVTLTAAPTESLLVQAINYEGYEMPPTEKLPANQIAILTEWVKQGLPGIPAEPTAEEIASEKQKSGSPQVNAETRKFWSFQPVQRPPVPQVADPAWQANPIDAFIASKLAAAGLKPNGPADRAALLRRVTYDLTGLPPEPSEVDAFLADPSPQAWERVVDRLLASPHYGEHWGRHWLDLVRYAETNSYERDGLKPHVWRYRDYVIRSFNQDKPYDQFVREQLAGDELQPQTPEGIIATGYYRLGIWDDEPADPEQAYYDDLDDIIQVTGTTLLGLTIGCARCHEHKLDPIPHRDYYRFLAYFHNIRRYGMRSHESVLEASVRPIALEAERQRHEDEVRKHEERVASVEADLKAIEAKVMPDLVGVEHDEFKSEGARVEIVGKRVPKLVAAEEFRKYKQLTRERNRLRAEKPPGLAQALCVTETGRTPRETHVLVRGNAHVLGEKVEPGVLEVLGGDAPAIGEATGEASTSGRRLAFANWVTSDRNPLTARVMANRVWQYHFGRGIVRSSSDFGFQGTSPTHPELLDWLASELVAGGWRLKSLHKKILLSQTYQLSSSPQAAAHEKDPENNLFWRFNMRRLRAEEIRDSILAVNGSLTRTEYAGPSVYVKIPQEVLAGQSRPGEGWGDSSPEDRNRRSVFIHVKRSLAPPILTAFDAADTDNSCPVRFVTTQPTQALGLLNSEFLQEQSQVFADYLRRLTPDQPDQFVRSALRRAWQREPSTAEVERGQQLIAGLQTKHRLSVDQAQRYFCLTVYNLNEFLYLD